MEGPLNTSSTVEGPNAARRLGAWLGLALAGNVLLVLVLAFWPDPPRALKAACCIGAAAAALGAAACAAGIVRAAREEIRAAVRYAERMRQTEERTRSILDTAGDGIITYDETGIIKSFNKAATRIFGYEPREAVGTRVWELVSGQTSAGIRLDTDEAAILEDGSEVKGKRKDGSTILLEPAISKVRQDGGLRFTLVLRDLTERKQAEDELRRTHFELDQRVRQRTTELQELNARLTETNQALRAEITDRKRAEEALRASEAALRAGEERYRSLVRLDPDAILLQRGDEITFLNPAALRLVGASSATQVKGLTLSDLITPESLPRLRDYLRGVLEARRPGPYVEVQVRRRDGKTTDAEAAAAAFKSRGAVAVQIVLRDITERKRGALILQDSERRQRTLARQLLEAQEVERRHIAHELHDEMGQSLTAAKITLQAALRVADATARPLLDDCLQLTEKALAQVRDLSVSLRPAALDKLGLVPSLRGLLDREAQRAGLVAHLDAEVLTPRLPPEVETACFRVVQEALTNVIRHARAREVWVRVRERPEGLFLSVRDDGVGFDVETARDRAAGGASLGLLGLQERVQLVGGRIEFHSTPGQGTEVRVQVPLAPSDRPREVGVADDGSDSRAAG